jgi:outer membrane protein assembly factor BamB
LKGTICGIFSMLLLASMFAGAFNVQSAQTNGSSHGEAVHPRSDWWPMFHHDPARTGYSNTTAPATTNNTLWTSSVWWSSSPAVVGGLVYVGSEDHNVYCLNAATGESVWNYTIGDLGVVSSPAVIGGLVYVGSKRWSEISGHLGDVCCLNATTGSLVWRYSTDWYVESSPAVVDGLVYVANEHDVFCLNATSGSLIWVCSLFPQVFSSPVVVGGLVYIAPYGSHVCCLNAATGDVVWWGSEGETWFNSPVVVDGFVYFGTGWGLYNPFYCLNAATGDVVWESTVEFWDLHSSAAVAGGFVYVGSDWGDNGVYCLNAATGEFVWKYTTGGNVDSSPAVVGGLVYVGSDDNSTYCLNATTGSLVWRYKTGGNVDSSPAVVNGVVYVASDDGYLYALGGLNVSTDWEPSRDSYSQINFVSAWSGGNCYGLSSTAVLYFMNYIMDNATCPYLPSQSPSFAHARANWTSDLELPANHAELNNASLAVMYHQVWDPNILYVPPSSENAEFYDKLVWTLESGAPAVLSMHGYDAANKDVYHAVVAYGIETLPNGIVNIKMSDPNVPQQEMIAHYYPPSQTFWYSAAGYDFDEFEVLTPNLISTAFAPEPWAGWFGTYWWWNNWLDFSVTGYSIVIADKSVTIKSNGLIDRFTEMGNSQTFVKAIPGSSGIEEGNVQVYAIPDGTAFTVSDPASDRSTIAITRVENVSGQLFGYGYLVNATAIQGQLNYEVTPSTSNLAISSGTTPLDVSATIFYATPQNHSIFQASNIQLDSLQVANFTVNNWQTLNDTSSSPVTLTISPVVPEFSPTLILPLFMITTLMAASIFKRKRIIPRHSRQ